MEENSKILKDVYGLLDEIKDTEIYPTLLTEFNTLNNEVQTELKEDIIVKDREKKIIFQTKRIQDVDNQNLKDISKALDLLSNDPLDKISIMDVAKKTFTIGLIRYQTLAEVEKMIKQVNGRTQEIIATESSNAEMLKQKRERVIELLTTENDLVRKYPAFAKKIQDEIIKLYTEEDKLFENTAIILIENAKKLIVDNPNIDPGLKAVELHDIGVDLAYMENRINTIITGKSKRVLAMKRELKGYIKALRTFITRFPKKVKDKTVINQGNQKSIRRLADNLAESIQNRRKIIIENAKK